MRFRVAGSVLLRHLGPRVFGAATPAAEPRPLLAGAGGEGGVWARLLATNAAEAAKEEVAASKDNVASTAAATAEAMQAAKEGAKNGVVSSYWGIVPAKLVNKDGAEWKWSCFRVSNELVPCMLARLHILS
jgi:ubiquinol oxidase